jgi:hypothetical protein
MSGGRHIGNQMRPHAMDGGEGGMRSAGRAFGGARVGFVGGIGRKRERDGRGKEQDHSGA